MWDTVRHKVSDSMVTIITQKKIHSRNVKTHLKKVNEGCYIYKTSASPFWYCKIRLPSEKKYLVRSLKETARVNALDSLQEIYDELRSNRGLERTSKKMLVNSILDSLIDEQKKLDGRSRSLRFSADDLYLIERDKDGIRIIFGKRNVSTITTYDMKEYLGLLDNNRKKTLAASTKNKHLYVLSKIFKMAYEKELISKVPNLPVLEKTDKPRPTFSKKQYKTLLSTTRILAKKNIKVRGVTLDMEFYYFIVFMTASFLRPVKSEIYALRHRDVSFDDESSCLSLSIVDGKTGYRPVTTLPNAVDYYNKIRKMRKNISEDDYVFFPQYSSREYCIQTVQRLFKYVLTEGNILTSNDGQILTVYSLRHFALQERLSNSEGQVNIYTLAKNAGTSVSMLERFYLKNLRLTKGMKDNLMSFGKN